METRIISGKVSADRLLKRIAEEVRLFEQTCHVVPGLAVVCVGEDPASRVYVRSKVRQALAAGMRSFEHQLPAGTTQRELLAVVEYLNADPTVHGILVQLPLPPGIDARMVTNAVTPEKDVDGFHVINAGKLAAGGSWRCWPNDRGVSA